MTPGREKKLKVTRIGRTLAAEISDLEINNETISNYRDEIYRAYLEHKVIIFREQSITADIFSSFGKIFGTAEIHHVRAMRHSSIPTLTMLSNQAEPGRNDVMKYFGDGWHADSSYKPVTAAATMLWGLEIPDEGGDTLFADTQAAYQDLPANEREALKKLRLRHQYRWSPNREDPWARWKFVGEAERRETPEVVHPLVKRHPETGLESLHIAPRIIGSVIGIEGMNPSESDRLIDELMAHATNQKYLHRHQWRKNDIIVWDNRSLLHSATTKNLPKDKVRRLLRITTTGTSLVGVTPEAGKTTVIANSELV
jgi:taurine dioxygenase